MRKIIICLLLLIPSSLLGVFSRANIEKAKIEIATQGGPSLKQERLKDLIGIVTAYYKPERHQRFFTSGSYRQDVRMNGRGITASGKPAQVGFAAADTRILPIGSVLDVPGHGRVVVEDTGGSIKGRRVDIFVGFGDKGRKRAEAWGWRQLAIRIVKLGEPRT